jgi:peptidoglycan/LPS O-acetylase OafA/YrhL
MSSAWARMREWSLGHLARPSTGRQFVPQVDGLRFVAIVAVILYHMQGYVADALGQAHAPTFLHRLLAQGYFGVPLFFALSGYIISAAFLGPRPPTLRAYMLRRLTRLEPPYFINLILIFVLKVIVLGVTFRELLPHLFASLVYLHGAIYGSHSEVNGVAWSLEVEWQFYLLAPLLLYMLPKLGSVGRGLVLWSAIGLGGIAFLVAMQWPTALQLSILHYFGFFIAGTWVSAIEARWPRTHGGLGHDAIGLLAAALILFVLMAAPLLQAVLPAATAVMLFAALRGPMCKRVLGWWPVHCMGAMCYSIYLYHFFVVSLLGKGIGSLIGWPAAPDWALLLMAAAGLPVVLVASAVPYLLIERPFMVWRPGRNRLADAFFQRNSV